MKKSYVKILVAFGILSLFGISCNPSGNNTCNDSITLNGSGHNNEVFNLELPGAPCILANANCNSGPCVYYIGHAAYPFVSSLNNRFFFNIYDINSMNVGDVFQVGPYSANKTVVEMNFTDNLGNNTYYESVSGSIKIEYVPNCKYGPLNLNCKLSIKLNNVVVGKYQNDSLITGSMITLSNSTICALKSF